MRLKSAGLAIKEREGRDKLSTLECHKADEIRYVPQQVCLNRERATTRQEPAEIASWAGQAGQKPWHLSSMAKRRPW